MKYLFNIIVVLRINTLVSTLSLYPSADNNLVLLCFAKSLSIATLLSLRLLASNMNSNWNTLVTPVDGYDNSRDIYNDETFIHGFPLRMPDEGYDTDRDVYNAETFGHITKRKKPDSFDAPPGLDANKRFKSVNEFRPSLPNGRPPLYPYQESRIRSIVREEIYNAARAAVGAVRPVATLAVPIDTNPSYLTPRRPTYRLNEPWVNEDYNRRKTTWAPAKFQRSYHPNEIYGCGKTGWEIMCNNNPELLIRQQEDNHLPRCNFDDLQDDN